jgi:hypothetical protein
MRGISRPLQDWWTANRLRCTRPPPIATPDQIILVLGDFRGDIWLMDLDSDSKKEL